NNPLIGNNTPINLPSAGNEMWVSLFLYFDRLGSDPRVDGFGNPIFFRISDSFKFYLVQGTPAAIGLAIKPTLPGDNSLLLGDIYLRDTTTDISGPNLDFSRKQGFTRIQDSMQSIKTESISSLLNPNLETLNSILSSLDSLNRSLKKKKEK